MDKIQKAGILYHPMIAAAGALARDLADFLTVRGVETWLESSWETGKARAEVPDTGLLLSVGGDGTILRSVQVVIGTNTPVVGVNLGHLGFMTELSASEAKNGLNAILAGEGWLDERSVLEASVHPAENGDNRTFYALNDVVAARGAVARVINIDVAVDGAKFAAYAADGIIAATATGSTGYALAAGGPILYPHSPDYVLVPVLPHLSPPYPVVLPPTAAVTVRVTTPYAATLSIDGHTNLPFPSGSTVEVKQSARKVKFLRIHPESSFYSTLQQKLKGKRDAVSG